MTDITFGNLTKADGSAIIRHNNTIVQATVFGPADVQQSKINYEEAVVDIIYKPKISIPSTSPAFDIVREVENLLKNVFKEIILTRLHPRTQISILVQEIHNNGSLLSCTINAVCCALLDAGIPMRCPVAGVSLDLDNEPSTKFDLVFDKDLNLITVLMRGAASDEQILSSIETAKKQAQDNFDIIRQQVKTKYTA